MQLAEEASWMTSPDHYWMSLDSLDVPPCINHCPVSSCTPTTRGTFCEPSRGASSSASASCNGMEQKGQFGIIKQHQATINHPTVAIVHLTCPMPSINTKHSIHSVQQHNNAGTTNSRNSKNSNNIAQTEGHKQ